MFSSLRMNLNMVAMPAALSGHMPAIIRGVLAGFLVFGVMLLWGMLRYDSVRNALEDALPAESIAITHVKAKAKFKPKHKPVQILDDVQPLKDPTPVSKDFLEDTRFGTLPKRNADGDSPHERYRLPVSPSDAPAIGVIVTHFGLSESASDALLRIAPHGLALALSPYANTPQDWVDKARDAGHEVWLHIPFEAQDYLHNSGGPDTILKRSSLALNTDRLHKLLGTVQGYTGVVAAIDETFLASEKLTHSLTTDLFQRGLAYIETSAQSSAFIKAIAAEHNSPYFHVNAHSLDSALLAAQASRPAIYAIETNPNAPSAVIGLIETARKYGVRVVPVSGLNHFADTAEDE